VGDHRQVSLADGPRLPAYAALSIAGCLWGTGFYFGKIALGALDVPHMILYRLLFACAGFVPVIALRGVVHRPADWPALWLAAVLGVPCLFLLQFEGLARTTVAHASLMVGTAPVLLGIGAALIGGEHVDRRRYALLGTSTAGAALILAGTARTAGSSGPTVLGDALVLVSLLAGVVWVLASKRLMHRYSSSTVTASVMTAGTAVLAAWVLAVHGRPPVDVPMRVWAALAAQGLLATTTATLLWNWGVRRVPTSQAGVFLNFEPVVGALLGVLLLGEQLGWTALAGGALIVGAAMAVARVPDAGGGQRSGPPAG
jgi:drug/metabolite transporter (DMT)-like permease